MGITDINSQQPQYTTYGAGLWNANSYIASGIPWASSSILLADGGTKKIEFYNITKFATIKNFGPGILYVGFSMNGAMGTPNNFNFPIAVSESYTGEWKIADMFLSSSGATNTSIIAGLTGIPRSALTTEGASNWSGSYGVG
jgi:hypothetical protein